MFQGIERLLGFEHGLPPGFGAVAATVGLVLLVAGWRLRWLSLALAGFATGAIGAGLLARLGHWDRLWSALIGGSALALLAIRFQRPAGFVLAGTALGCATGLAGRLWSAAGLFWGAGLGFVLGGLLSLWSRRLALIVASAFWGSLGLLVGGSAVLGAWVFRPASGFSSRHPFAWVVMVGLLCLIGSAVQLRLAPGPLGERQEDG